MNVFELFGSDKPRANKNLKENAEISVVYEKADMCKVCGQTPCNCTHITESNQIERKIARTQALIQNYYNRSRETSNDIKRDHYIDMARQLESELEGMINDANQAEHDENEIARHDSTPSSTWDRGGLQEFAIDKSNDDGRSKLIGSIVQLLKSGKKVDFYVPGIRGHVSGIGGQGDSVTLKRWNKPYSKINYSLSLDSSDDNRFVLKMIRPDYYQVVEKGDLGEAVDPQNFDSDVDYHNAVKKQSQQQFSGDWDVWDEIASLENQIKYAKSSALAHTLYKQIDQLKQQAGIADDEDEYEHEYDADIRARKGVDEARAATASFRAGNKKRAELNAMSDEERRAYDKAQQEKQRKRDDARLERERQKLAAKKGVAEGSDNITAVFSGYGNYMKGRAANVFKHYGITVLDQQYDEDEDIAEYTVSGSKEALDKARAYLERSDQFGGMILKQGVAEAEQQKGADYRDPKEADYGDDYQDMVKRVGQKAKAQDLAKQQKQEEDLTESFLYAMKKSGYDII